MEGSVTRAMLLALQPADPLHEKFVEIRGEDRQESGAFQKRNAMSWASSRTRWLKSSQLNSRLR